MPFQLQCNNLKCKKMGFHTLNVATNKVECLECGNEITNINHFTKVQLKTLGQIKRGNKTAFAIKCQKCRMEALPKLDGNDKLVCAGCQSPITVAKPMEIMVREQIKKGGNDI